MEKNGCSFRKTSRDSLETFKHQNKTPSPNKQYKTLYIYNTVNKMKTKVKSKVKAYQKRRLRARSTIFW